jgi:single-strand DNA-binding protein
MLTITGVGRLGQAPKMQYTPSGTAVTNFSVAADCGFGDKKETVWVSLASFGQQAETLNQYLQKGMRIAFTADVQRIRTYTKKDQTTGVSLDAKVLSFSFLDFSDKAEGKTEAEPEEF